MVTTAATRYWHGNDAAPLIGVESLARAKYCNGEPRGHHYCAGNIEYDNTLLRYTPVLGYSNVIQRSNGPNSRPRVPQPDSPLIYPAISLEGKRGPLSIY